MCILELDRSGTFLKEVMSLRGRHITDDGGSRALVMPAALHPRVRLLALATFQVIAPLDRAHPTTVRAHRLVASCTLQECRDLLSVRKQTCDVLNSLIGFLSSGRVVFMVLNSETGSFESTACSTAASTASLKTVRAFEISGLPFLASVGVSRVHACPVELNSRTVADDAQVAFL